MDDRAVLRGSAGELPRQRQRVDVTPSPVAETAEKEVGADAAFQLDLVQQFYFRAVLYPLTIAVLGDRFEAARAVRRLDSAGLFGLAFKAVFPHQIKKGSG